MLPGLNVEDLVEFFQGKGYPKKLALAKYDFLCNVYIELTLRFWYEK